MGAGVSGWRLARAVSREGHLGVIAGTALDVILARRLQAGDPGGHLRRAVSAFPVPEIAERVLQGYFVDGGIPDGTPFRRVPIYSMRPPRRLLELTVVANFAEVFLAKEGHDGLVGINYLEKIQLPNLASLYGAMLAGVDYVLMGAGIPREIPGVLDRFVDHAEASLKISLAGEQDDGAEIRFDPAELVGPMAAPLERPAFLGIVSSTTLAIALAKRATGHVDGFVIEGHVAGGHNAPPRGPLELDETGQPIYGKRDAVDLAKIRRLGRPFWLAGAYGRRDGLAAALAEGATGVQVGTPFALCRESEIDDDIKREIRRRVVDGTLKVRTDPIASPTGFPFKLILLPETVSSPEIYARRPRVCDLGFLRTAYRREDGGVGFRCRGEPVADFVRKGGDAEATAGARCLCNGLLANIGVGQVQNDGYREPPIVTCGADLSLLSHLLAGGASSYGAADVIRSVTAG